ncbi:hypothetical protein QTV44_002513 [Vibrio vulnificus]|nr:hypothetical protein [Vibrio vulnificus]
MLGNLYLASPQGHHPDDADTLYLFSELSVADVVATVEREELDVTHLALWICPDGEWVSIPTPWQGFHTPVDYYSDELAQLASSPAFNSSVNRRLAAYLYGGFDIRPIQHLFRSPTFYPPVSAFRYNPLAIRFLKKIAVDYLEYPYSLSSQTQPNLAVDNGYVSDDRELAMTYHIASSRLFHPTAPESEVIIQSRFIPISSIKSGGLFTLKNGVYRVVYDECDYLYAPPSFYHAEPLQSYFSGRFSLSALAEKGIELYHVDADGRWVNCHTNGFYFESNREVIRGMLNAWVGDRGISTGSLSRATENALIVELTGLPLLARCLLPITARNYHPLYDHYVHYFRWVLNFNINFM